MSLKTLDDIEVGQYWIRPNGKVVKLVDSRAVNGVMEYQLEPVPKGTGRRSWKWAGAILSELTYYGTGQRIRGSAEDKQP